MNFAQLTQAVSTQVNDELIYYAPGTEGVTVLCADRDPLNMPMKDVAGRGVTSFDPTCNG